VLLRDEDNGEFDTVRGLHRGDTRRDVETINAIVMDGGFGQSVR
jgi:hypothetical protein